MIATAYAPALTNIDGQRITIECDITNGLPGLVIVGLGDKAVEEAKERVKSALKNSGFSLPPKRITVNLAPADLPKDGSGYDLGIAMAILAASGQLDPVVLSSSIFLGELALDGHVNPTRGSIIAAQLASNHDLQLFIPQANADEARLIDSVKIFAITSLIELYHHLSGQKPLSAHKTKLKTTHSNSDPLVDFSDIYGQFKAKRAVEIAAAGGHNILLTGPPGTGKTLLAKSIIGLLPPPNSREVIEIAKLYSLVHSNMSKFPSSRPFRAPHHTASSVALIGGGSRPRPGEISLSHAGILFLDELPEFPRSVLEVLRQPLEDGAITIARALGSLTFPAHFMLVATANPCPCGYYTDEQHACNCTSGVIERYRNKISGPLMDRIDIVTEVGRIEQQESLRADGGETTSVVAKRIQAARVQQANRQYSHHSRTNASMTNSEVKKYCKLNNEAQAIARLAIQELGLSTRSYIRSLKVARTIADLDGEQQILTHHFSEALHYRPQPIKEKKHKLAVR